MKKYIITIIVINLLIIGGCSNEKIDNALETKEQTNTIVIRDGEMLEGKYIWDKFVKDTNLGIRSEITIRNIYSADDESPEMGFEHKISYYNGNYWLYDNDKPIHMETNYDLQNSHFDDANPKQYKYLLKRSGHMPNAATDDTVYFLTNEKDLSYDKLMKSLFSSNSTDIVSAKIIFSEHKSNIKNEEIKVEVINSIIKNGKDEWNKFVEDTRSGISSEIVIEYKTSDMLWNIKRDYIRKVFYNGEKYLVYKIGKLDDENTEYSLRDILDIIKPMEFKYLKEYDVDGNIAMSDPISSRDRKEIYFANDDKLTYDDICYNKLLSSRDWNCFIFCEMKKIIF